MCAAEVASHGEGVEILRQFLDFLKFNIIYIVELQGWGALMSKRIENALNYSITKSLWANVPKRHAGGVAHRDHALLREQSPQQSALAGF